jgi:hypothetical protein
MEQKPIQQKAGMRFCPYCGVDLFAVGVGLFVKYDGELVVNENSVCLTWEKKEPSLERFECGACEMALPSTGWWW